MTSSKNVNFSFVLTFLFIFSLIIYSCDETDSSTNPSTNTVKFLMGYAGGGDQGETPGIVSVDSKGHVNFESEYYPSQHNIDFVDMKNGRIAFAAENPPEGSSCIAYADIDNLSDIKFIPIPEGTGEDYYWDIPRTRPQVMSDGRIIIKIVNNTVNQYDDWIDGMLAIYNPKDGSFEFSGSLSPFVLSQPEQGTDTEGGSMGNYFVLSQNEEFVCLTAYGAGTDMGSYHEDYRFIVKYDLNTQDYTRVMEGRSILHFISMDNNDVVASLDDGKKYRINVDNGNKEFLDSYNDKIFVGQFGKKSNYFFKVWRGSGITLFDQTAGYIYEPILGQNLPGKYTGLGRGGQFSADESSIYFMASTDYYTNYASEFTVYKTKLTLNEEDTNPDSLFTLPAEYDKKLFLLLTK